MFQRAFEEPDRIIVVTATGEVMRAEVDQHYDALREMIAPMPAAGRPIRALGDAAPLVRPHTG